MNPLRMLCGNIVRFMIAFCLVWAGLVDAPVKPVRAATWMVTNTNDDGPGSLRAVINNVSTVNGDTITFDSSLSGATIKLTTEIYTSKSLTIDGSSLAAAVVLNGQDQNRIFNFSIGEGDIILKGLRLTNGLGWKQFSAGDGGAVLIIGNGKVILEDLTIESSHAANGDGGGVFITGAESLLIKNSRFKNNLADMGKTGARGGALFVENTGDVLIEDCFFEANKTNGTGGAIFIDGGVPTKIVNGYFTGNRADEDAGAIYASN